MNLFLYVLVVLIWGTTWIALKWQLGEVPIPLSIAYRFALAALVMFALLAWRRQLVRPRGDAVRLRILARDDKTGEMREVATYRATDPVTRRQITVAPDVGWSYNAGAAAWQPDPKRYTGDLAKLAKKELP